ncbi:MAG TPA: rRNA maturation RNase YbeY [Bacteroidales bacterium]|nr:rRNA maturation RNase YbeY [Bacteroidales bacterium]HSA42208.1 rRNA maturation RNase YbeY [Bacteroidales bacterium]
MAVSAFRFFFEDVPDITGNKARLRQWLGEVFRQEGKKAGQVNFIFCNDACLLSMNRQYLQHDTLTDVISFRLSEDHSPKLDGDIYISLDRVEENAMVFKVSRDEEVRRVMVHGLLHLMDYLDDTPDLKAIMSAREDHYLDLYRQLP